MFRDRDLYLAVGWAVPGGQPPDHAPAPLHPLHPLHPLLSSRLMLLEYTGRRTGRTISIPVGYFPWDDGDVMAMSSRPTWVANLREGLPVRLRLRGRWISATPEVLDDAGARADLLAEMGRRWGPKRLAVLRLGLPADRPATPEGLDVAARRCYFVRFRPLTNDR